MGPHSRERPPHRSGGPFGSQRWLASRNRSRSPRQDSWRARSRQCRRPSGTNWTGGRNASHRVESEHDHGHCECGGGVACGQERPVSTSRRRDHPSCPQQTHEGTRRRNEIGLMKPRSILSNASRGSIVDERALIRALESRAIAGAAVDVFDQEPLPASHPFRSLDNVLATPHVGYVTEDLYRTFYSDVVPYIY